MTQRPKMPNEEYNKPMGSGKKSPLPSLPDREWLKATIRKVKFQYSIFNNKIQNITDQDDNEILDDDNNPIPRREFEIVFEFVDYFLPNNAPRKAWLRMSASKGENAHLPVFMASVAPDAVINTPKDVIEALEGMPVMLQLANKTNKKDPSKPPYQNVLFDAVKVAGSKISKPAPAPMDEGDLRPTEEPPTEGAAADDEIPF